MLKDRCHSLRMIDAVCSAKSNQWRMIMNNFLYQNKTKVFFGKGGVGEYLGCTLKEYGDTVMLAYGGGSI